MFLNHHTKSGWKMKFKIVVKRTCYYGWLLAPQTLDHNAYDTPNWQGQPGFPNRHYFCLVCIDFSLAASCFCWVISEPLCFPWEVSSRWLELSPFLLPLLIPCDFFTVSWQISKRPCQPCSPPPPTPPLLGTEAGRELLGRAMAHCMLLKAESWEALYTVLSLTVMYSLMSLWQN